MTRTDAVAPLITDSRGRLMLGPDGLQVLETGDVDAETAAGIVRLTVMHDFGEVPPVVNTLGSFPRPGGSGTVYVVEAAVTAEAPDNGTHALRWETRERVAELAACGAIGGDGAVAAGAWAVVGSGAGEMAEDAATPVGKIMYIV